MAGAVFPLDIESAASYGIAKWRKEFTWPLLYDDFIHIESQIKEILDDFIRKNAGSHLRNRLVLINYKIFALAYGNLINSLKILKSINEKGLKPLYGHRSITFRGLIESGAPLDVFSDFPPIERPHIIRRFKKQGGIWKYFFNFNKARVLSLKSIAATKRLVADHSYLNDLAKEYILTGLDGVISVADFHNWLSGFESVQLSAAQTKEAEALAGDLTAAVTETAVHNGLVLTTQQLAYIYGIALECFIKTMSCSVVLKNRISKLKPLHLLVGGSSTAFIRTLSSVVRDYGGIVSGFDHGVPLVCLSGEPGWLELSTVDRFYTYSRNLARCLKEVIRQYPPANGNAVAIASGETRKFHNLWKSKSSEPVPRAIKKVMIVANVFRKDSDMCPFFPMPALVQLDTVLRIIDALDRGGYEILFKPHPHSMFHKHAGSFFGNNVRVIKGRFEDVMDMADAFIFYYTRTTTLGTALCTNKPIVSIDGDWEKWLPEMKSCFTRRCRVVRSKFDDKNRLIIDENELNDALNERPKRPDTEFLKTYMFPSTRYAV